MGFLLLMVVVGHEYILLAGERVSQIFGVQKINFGSHYCCLPNNFVCSCTEQMVRLPSLPFLKIDIAVPLAFVYKMGMEVTWTTCEWKHKDPVLLPCVGDFVDVVHPHSGPG